MKPQIGLFVFVYSASGGELQMLLDKDEVPEERQVKRLMRQILDGLVYLHSINVAHLDIKVRLFQPVACNGPIRLAAVYWH
jgi:serine/threonine protein kinase